MADRCFVAVDIDDPPLKAALRRAQGALVATGVDVAVALAGSGVAG